MNMDRQKEKYNNKYKDLNKDYLNNKILIHILFLAIINQVKVQINNYYHKIEIHNVIIITIWMINNL